MNEEKIADNSSKSGDEVNNNILDILPEDERTIYVEGISYNASKDDLQTFFTTNGCDVLSIRMPLYQDSNRPSGQRHFRPVPRN